MWVVNTHLPITHTRLQPAHTYIGLGLTVWAMTVMVMIVIAHTVSTIAMAVKQPWQSQLASVAVSTSQVFDVDNEVLRLGMLRLSENVNMGKTTRTYAADKMGPMPRG